MVGKVTKLSSFCFSKEKNESILKIPLPTYLVPTRARVPILSEETSMKQMSSTAVVVQEALLLPTPSFEARKCRARREVDDNLLASGFSIINLCSAFAGSTLCFPRELGDGFRNSFKKFLNDPHEFCQVYCAMCYLLLKTYVVQNINQLGFYRPMGIFPILWLSNHKDTIFKIKQYSGGKTHHRTRSCAKR